MAEGETKVPVTDQRTSAAATPAASLMQAWRPFDTLRREVDRLFDDFTLNPFRLPLRRPAFDLEPFWSADSWLAQPAMDLVERDSAFELTAEMPGLDGQRRADGQGAEGRGQGREKGGLPPQGATFRLVRPFGAPARDR